MTHLVVDTHALYWYLILEILKQDGRFQILPFDLECVEQLPEMDLHDAMIVSLALVLANNSPQSRVCIITKDEEITKCHAGMVIW